MSQRRRVRIAPIVRTLRRRVKDLPYQHRRLQQSSTHTAGGIAQRSDVAMVLENPDKNGVLWLGWPYNRTGHIVFDGGGLRSIPARNTYTGMHMKNDDVVERNRRLPICRQQQAVRRMCCTTSTETRELRARAHRLRHHLRGWNIYLFRHKNIRTQKYGKKYPMALLFNVAERRFVLFQHIR